MSRNGIEHDDLLMSIEEFKGFLEAMWAKETIVNEADQSLPKLVLKNFLLPNKASREEVITYLMYCFGKLN